MSNLNNFSTLPQLTEGTNFTNWKFRIKLILEEKGVVEVMENPITEANKASDAKARSIIVQCISDKYLEYIKKGKTAKDMIKCLEDVFERKSTFNKLHLRRQLLTLKCKVNEKLQDHFLKFDTIINNLESTGTKMEETDKVCHLLLTMPDNYENVVTAIETMSVEREINLDFVKSCLLDAEIKQEDKGTTSTTKEVAFSSLKQVECFKCHKKGHIASECRTRKPNYPRQGRGYRGNYRGRNINHQPHNSHHQSHVTQEEETYSFIAMSEEEITCNNADINENDIEFIIDSGATENLIKEDMKQHMHNIEELENRIKIKTANGQSLLATMKGIITIYSKGRKINVETLIVPGLYQNIISVKKLIKRNYKVIFNKYGARIINGDQIWSCNQRNGLFILQGNLAQEEAHSNICKNNNILWHQRLGHLNRKGLHIMKLPVADEICESCMKGKLTRLPFKLQSRPRSRRIGELIYTDIAGPVTPTSQEGYKYFQTITDDYSHFVKVYLSKNKSEAAENLKNYIREINTQLNVKVNRIRCDNGGEFSSNDLKQYCLKKGISIEYTQAYSPQQNGVSERMNRTLYNKARTMIIETGLPKYLWSESIMCAAYQLNRCPSAAINNNIPANIYLGKLDLEKLRVFGAKAWAVILPRNSKLEERAQETRMVGYAKNGYRLWNPVTDRIITSRDVKFDESQVKYEIKNVNIKYKMYNDEENQEEDTKDQEKQDELTSNEESNQYEATTSSNRIVRKPKHLDEYELYTAFCLVAEEDPKSYEEAIDKDEGWQKAIKNELEAHKKMNTWTVTTLPTGKKAIDAKWIFRTKEDGTKKARLVARGFQEDNNFNNNYSPVARLTTIRLFLVQSIQRDWNVKQLDVPTAFLNSELHSEVYMKIPKGLKEEKGKVLKMNKGLYGLRESPKCWNIRFNQFATDNGLKRSANDFCLYIGNEIWLVIFVDDILITGEEKEMNKLINSLRNEFKVKELGVVKNFLGMEIERNENEMKITQKRQIQNMLEKFKMQECKGAKSPITKGFQVNETEEEAKVPFRELIGSLMFVSTVSRPDISYATSYLSQFLDKPKKSIWMEAKRTLRYLKETIDFALTYTRGDKKEIQTFSDADWANDKQDRRSISGCVSLYCGNTIAWFSRKQACVSLSTAEAEYIAAATSVCDLINIQRLCNDFDEEVKTILYLDNKGAIDMTQSFENSKRTKHIDIRYHFIKDLVTSGQVEIKYVESNNNLADMFTKALTNVQFSKLRRELKILE